MFAFNLSFCFTLQSYWYISLTVRDNFQGKSVTFVHCNYKIKMMKCSLVILLTITIHQCHLVCLAVKNKCYLGQHCVAGSSWRVAYCLFSEHVLFQVYTRPLTLLARCTHAPHTLTRCTHVLSRPLPAVHTPPRLLSLPPRRNTND